VTLAFAFRRLHFAELYIDGETSAKRRKVPVSHTKQLVPTAVREIPESFIKPSEIVELISSIIDRVGNDRPICCFASVTRPLHFQMELVSTSRCESVSA
jgi:hypothetical protein